MSAASLQSSRYYDSFVRAVFDNGAKAAAPGVPEAETQVFASALERETTGYRLAAQETRLAAKNTA